MAGTSRSGRKPKPSALKTLAGNPGKRALNRREPTPAVGLPPRRPELDADATAEWQRLGPALVRLGVLTEADGEAFTALCVLYGRAVQIRRAMQDDAAKPLTYRYSHDADGNERVEAKENPLWAIERRTLQLWRAYLGEFGLTPTSRAKVIATQPETADPFAEFEHGVH